MADTALAVDDHKAGAVSRERGWGSALGYAGIGDAGILEFIFVVCDRVGFSAPRALPALRVGGLRRLALEA
jgi:hypothetical protein